MSLRISQDAPETLRDDGWHNAFTDLTWWRGQLWCAFRRAVTHGITPPGTIQILAGSPTATDWTLRHELTLPQTDLRDPRFLSTPDALYCLLGAYHPRPGARCLSSNAAENTIQTYVTWTRDGHQWAPVHPILRPNYWGWSSILVSRRGQQTLLYVAAYHTGMTHTETSSIVLFVGYGYTTLVPVATIYDGANHATDEAPHYRPAEPVLFRTASGALGCCVRSEGSMDLGIGRFPYQAADWRWQDTRRLMHPSATITSPYGTLLVGRHVPPPQRATRDAASPQVGLWRLMGRGAEPLARFPSYGDCAYAGLVAMPEPDTYLLSYYTQAPANIRTLLTPEAAAVQLLQFRLTDDGLLLI